MMERRLELVLGIISGDQKRALECYVDARDFRQRKTYDEYYVDVTSCTHDNIEINDLTILAELFKVLVLDDCILISDKP